MFVVQRVNLRLRNRKDDRKQSAISEDISLITQFLALK
jgi:hypothetical protein